MGELTFEPFYFPVCSKICNEIISNSKINMYITENQFDDFSVSWEGMFLHQVYHFLKEVDWDEYDERLNSVFYSYLESQTMQLEWIVFSLCCGHYDLVLRELRNIVESAFLFFRVDLCNDTVKKSGDEKFKLIEELDESCKYGKKVFKNSGYADWEKVYLNIYRPLCGYTHTRGSFDNNMQTYPEYNGMLMPKYDEDRILECLYYLQSVIILEVDMMKIILKSSYDIDSKGYFDKIFDKCILPHKNY